MNYYIDYEKETGKILGFIINEAEKQGEIVEADFTTFHDAQKFNKIVVDGDNVTFELVDYRTPEEIADEERKQKVNEFNQKWENLKIGYNPTSKTAFQIQYGNEINDTLDASTLYNVSDLNNITQVTQDDYLFSLDRDNTNTMTAKQNAEWRTDTKAWYGSLGTFNLTIVEIGVILSKADEIIQQYADNILGV